MTQWKVILGNRRCYHNNGYGDCEHPKVERTQGMIRPPCRKKYCPIKMKGQ